MSRHDHFPAGAATVRRSDLRRRIRRGALLGLLPHLRIPRSPMRPSAGSVVLA